VRNESDARLAISLAAVRITWTVAIGICVLAILSGFLSGTDGSDSSRQLPGFTFADRGDAPQLLPESVWLDQAPAVDTKTAAPQDNGSQRAQEKQAPGESHSRDSGGHVPNRTGSQPEDPGGGTTPGTTRPNPPQAPSVTPPDTPQTPSGTQTDPPQAPSENPEPSQVTVQASVSESEVSVSASKESVSAQVKTPVGTTDVTVGLS
jgi:FtsZ-interacting cell division protein ZipA